MGCFVAGCLVVVAVVAFFIAVGGVGAWLLYGRAVTMFTSRQPADVRIANVSDVDLHNAERKLNQLGQAAANNEETTVEFTAAELNAMIAREPLFAELNNRARIAMADSLISVEMSAPLDAAPLPKLRGRWLNGGARFGFSFGLGRHLIAASTTASGARWRRTIGPPFFGNTSRQSPWTGTDW